MLFPDQLREATSANKDLNRQVQELTTIRMQLEGERDGLAAELSDTRDALRDAQMRLDAANNALSALRSEMEARLREKDDELENLRYAPSSSCSSDQRLTSSIHSLVCILLSSVYSSQRGHQGAWLFPVRLVTSCYHS